MEPIIYFLCFAVLSISLAVFANKARRTHRLHFELKKNCLLTRWPVVFLTGQRSIFYFSRYWNLYPVLLAEHGYEVFTLHLPWKSSSERSEWMRSFLKEQHRKKYHFVMDAPTALQMKNLLWAHPAAVSVTVVTNTGPKPGPENLQFRPLEMTGTGQAGLLLKFSFWLHELLTKNSQGPTLDTLGALQDSALANGTLLLARMQELAEEDYQEEASP